MFRPPQYAHGTPSAPPSLSAAGGNKLEAEFLCSLILRYYLDTYEALGSKALGTCTSCIREGARQSRTWRPRRTCFCSMPSIAEDQEKRSMETSLVKNVLSTSYQWKVTYCLHLGEQRP